MPTYDYECEACTHTFEKFQGMSEPVLRKCPTCGRQKLRRLIGSGSGIIFKGSGFYETDYRRKASGDAVTPSSPAAAADSSGTSSPEKKESPTPASSPKS